VATPSIIIPAAGLGRRMKSYGPKCLIKLGQETVIARQIRLLREVMPSAGFVVVAGFQHERLRRALPADIQVVLNKDYETTNTAYSIALGLARTPPRRPALVVYSDIVFSREVVMDLPLGRSFVVVDPSPANRDRELEVGVNVVDGLAARLSFGLPAKWLHICLLAPREKAIFCRAATPPARRRYLGYEILNEVIDAGGQFEAIERSGSLVEIDYSKDIERARQLAH
jgi:choline kinase